MGIPCRSEYLNCLESLAGKGYHSSLNPDARSSAASCKVSFLLVSSKVGKNNCEGFDRSSGVRPYDSSIKLKTTSPIAKPVAVIGSPPTAETRSS